MGKYDCKFDIAIKLSTNINQMESLLDLINTLDTGDAAPEVLLKLEYALKNELSAMKNAMNKGSKWNNRILITHMGKGMMTVACGCGNICADEFTASIGDNDIIELKCNQCGTTYEWEAEFREDEECEDDEHEVEQDDRTDD